MSLSQEERLRLLGLWPHWKLRDRAEPEENSPALAVAEPATPALAPTLTPDPVQAAGAASAEARVAPPPATEPLTASAGGSIVIPAAPGPPSETTPETALKIAPESGEYAQHDWAGLNEAVANCTRCALHASRSRPVFGVGDPQADWLIVGEAPGAEEDRLGEPFVGQAGKLLDAMLAAIGLARGRNVYIANVLKSRPPGNRNPTPDEVAACLPYLERQIALLQPRIILAMGRFAAQNLLKTEDSITRLRGQVHRYQGVPLVVTYHPAYLLRNLPDKAKAWDDLCLARATYQALQER